MQIDWLTVAAQIVNFLILVWLLQKLLYGPIINAMKRREERIEERLSDARETREAAEEEAQNLKQKQADLDARKEEIREQARQEAEDLRRRREREIEQEADEQRAALRERIEAERDEALRDIRKRAAASTFTAIRDILRDFANADLTNEMATRFAEHLKTLPGDDKDRLSKAAQEADEPARVIGSTELPSAIRSKLTRAIHQTFAEDLEVEYETDPDMLLGLRLSISGQTAEWSASRHLDRLEEDIRETLTHAVPAQTQKDAA